MPKRKKLPSVPNYIDGENNHDEYLVQKSNPLQSLSETSMSLVELKILDVYLSRINSHNPGQRYVRFEKGELEHLLGVTRILKDDLNKRLRNLFQVVTIRDHNKNDGFTNIALFSKASAFRDDNGLWQVDLACTPEAMEYIFNVEGIGYLSYLLRNIVELTSRYSYVLYLYLENNKFRGQWSISLSDLKRILNCKAERYNEFRFFNAEILKKCYKEINEKTRFQYSYEPIRKGRKVAEIRFTVKNSGTHRSLPPSGQPADMPAQIGSDQTKELQQSDGGFQDAETDSFEVRDVLIPPESEAEHLRRLAGACENRFSPIEMREICRIVFSHEYGSPYSTDREIQDSRVNYLSMMYTTFKFQLEYNIAHGRPIRNRFKYFLRMLENDSSYLDY